MVSFYGGVLLIPIPTILSLYFSKLQAASLRGFKPLLDRILVQRLAAETVSIRYV